MIARALRAIGVIGAVAVLVATPLPARAVEAECITEYASDVEVHADGSMTVTETIKLIAAGKAIRHGIYRDFPAVYRDRLGNKLRVGFTVRAVERDGRPEPFSVERRANGWRIYMGRKDALLAPGAHSYRLTYSTDLQIGYFKDYDELYWNAIGADWAFPIDRARVTVALPRDAPVIAAAAFTGPEGSRESDAVIEYDANGNTIFRATRPLAPREGLTIAISWPKGYVAEPSAARRLAAYVDGSAPLLAGLAGLAVLFGYFVVVWLMVGRDPRKGAIVPLFSPPDGFSPAAMRFVMRMGFDERALAAAIIDMAVKGYLAIREEANGDFALERTGEAAKRLAPGERRVGAKLFAHGARIVLEQKNHRTMAAAIKALRESLREDFERIHYRRNRTYLIPGAVLTIMTLGVLVLVSPRPGEASFMLLWLGMWTLGCLLLARRILRAWRSRSRPATAFSVAFALPFLGGEVFGVWALSDLIAPPVVVLLVVLILVNALFYELLKAPTTTGRRAMNRIEGFRMYLSVAEKDRLDRLNPPEKTPALFEKYLPHALALDVENQWSEQFADELGGAAETPYSPRWYRGRSWTGGGGLAGFADGLGGAFVGAIAASSTAPGSSSGTGGGGFSGGGGGGGGGGGW